MNTKLSSTKGRPKLIKTTSKTYSKFIQTATTTQNLCNLFLKDNIIETTLDLQKNLTEYYHNLHRDLQSRYKTLKVKEEKREEPGTLDKNEGEKTSKVAGSSVLSSLFTKILSSVKARLEIKADGDSLKNYIIDNINEFETLQKELAVAFSGVPDAAKLVIKALDNYDFAECGLTHIEEKRPQISINRKCRILLLSSSFFVTMIVVLFSRMSRIRPGRLQETQTNAKTVVVRIITSLCQSFDVGRRR